MEKKINNILFITTNDGRRLTFKVLFTYYSEKFHKDYAVFYNEDDDNNLIAYSFEDCNNLHPIESKEEYQELEEALQKYDEEQAANTK